MCLLLLVVLLGVLIRDIDGQKQEWDHFVSVRTQATNARDCNKHRKQTLLLSRAAESTERKKLFSSPRTSAVATTQGL